MLLSRRQKRKIRALLIFPMTFKGFPLGRAKDWWLRKRRDLKNNPEIPKNFKRWAHKHGFLGYYAFKTGINKTNYKNYISEENYLYVQPINKKYNKWLNDQVSINKVYKPFEELFLTIHYHFYIRDGEWKIIADSEDAKKFGVGESSVIDLIKFKGIIRLSLSNTNRPVMISYKNYKFYLNEEEISEEMLLEFIFRTKKGGLYRNSVIIITDPIYESNEFTTSEENTDYRLKLYILNSEGDNPHIADGYLIKRNIDRKYLAYFDKLKLENKNYSQNEDIDDNKNNLEQQEGYKIVQWYKLDAITGELPNIPNLDLHKIPLYHKLQESIKGLCYYTPQIEFFAVNVVITDSGFKIEDIEDIPTFPREHVFEPAINTFLKEKYTDKKALFSNPFILISHAIKRITLQIRKRFTNAFFPPTLYPYLSIRTIQECTNDFFTNKDANLKTKMWAYKHGFQSYRLEQYGINKENHENFISDIEYKWLRHINNKYRTWFEDKVTIKYILRDFKDSFPGYYYYTAVKNGNSKIIPLMDCPEGYEATYDDIFRLVREKKILALKPDEGSHGEGFYKFSYSDEKYFLNFEEVTKDRVIELFTDVDNQYLITEYIIQHPDIAKIYNGSVNTIRLTVFKKDGIEPYIGNGYMRFGTTETGGVDNIGAGGIGVDVNVETGHFYNPVRLKDGAILVPTEYHPDTGEKIEGYLPNWDYVRETILKIAKSVPEMEYFGFDLAITESGIKFPEINRFPDFPRINKLTPETIDYLLYKLDAKRTRYGYNTENPPKRLINLPKRKNKYYTK